MIPFTSIASPNLTTLKPPKNRSNSFYVTNNTHSCLKQFSRKKCLLHFDHHHFDYHFTRGREDGDHYHWADGPSKSPCPWGWVIHGVVYFFRLHFPARLRRLLPHRHRLHQLHLLRQCSSPHGCAKRKMTVTTIVSMYTYRHLFGKSCPITAIAKRTMSNFIKRNFNFRYSVVYLRERKRGAHSSRQYTYAEQLRIWSYAAVPRVLQKHKAILAIHSLITIFVEERDLVFPEVSLSEMMRND